MPYPLDDVLQAVRLLTRATGYLQAGDGDAPRRVDRDEAMNLVDDAREVLDRIAEPASERLPADLRRRHDEWMADAERLRRDLAALRVDVESTAAAVDAG